MARKSDVTYWRLMQAGLRRGSGATEAKRGMEKAGRDSKGAARQVVTDTPREEDMRHRPLPRSVSPGKLELVISNRCEPTRSKAGKPLPGVDSHLVLVWSDGHLVTRRP